MHLFGFLIADLFIKALQLKRLEVPPRRVTEMLLGLFQPGFAIHGNPGDRKLFALLTNNQYDVLRIQTT